jgi:3'-phosphoadenosine 5'-phosphosulfate sulfotransferase (PAPS reductase)/FAD synthetase
MSILKRQLEDGRIYAMLPQHKRKIDIAMRDIRNIISRCPDFYVSNSWGKQSVVLAHLVYSVSPQIENIHWTGEDAELIGNFAEVRNAFLSSFRVPYTELVRHTSLRDAISAYHKEHDRQGYFVGLCAYESKGRQKSIANQRSGSVLPLASGMVRCCPIGEWTQDDLAAYIAVHNLPLLNPYHKFGLSVRTSTGARHGSYTERATDLMGSSKAAELQKRMESRT